MANRKPLVIIGGQVQQLPAGDTIDAPQGGGDQQVITNDEAGAIVIGTPVYMDANDGVKKAQANASGTRKVTGIVAVASIGAAGQGPITVGGVITATTTQWDAVVVSGSGGLIKDTTYYLDAATAGKITATAPSTAGQYVVEVGIGLSTTELLVRVQKDILL